MKVIFLDIDGVLNTNEGKLELAMVARFKKILQSTGAQVVLSSSWKNYEESRHIVRSVVCNFIDCTPHVPVEGKDHIERRGIEIQAWLDTHLATSRYVIIDDAHESFILPNQVPNFFKTMTHIGLTEEIADEIIRHLNQ